jgi:hypothetical protein
MQWHSNSFFLINVAKQSCKQTTFVYIVGPWTSWKPARVQIDVPWVATVSAFKVFDGYWPIVGSTCGQNCVHCSAQHFRACISIPLGSPSKPEAETAVFWISENRTGTDCYGWNGDHFCWLFRMIFSNVLTVELIFHCGLVFQALKEELKSMHGLRISTSVPERGE